MTLDQAKTLLNKKDMRTLKKYFEKGCQRLKKL